MFELKTSQTPMSVILETNHWPLHVANVWVFLLGRNTNHLDRELFQVKVEGYALQHHVDPLLDEFHVAVECTSLLGPPKWKNHPPSIRHLTPLIIRLGGLRFRFRWLRYNWRRLRCHWYVFGHHRIGRGHCRSVLSLNGG